MRELRVETASCLAIEFIGDLDSFQAEKPSNWLVQSDDDPNFQAGIAPATIGRIRQLDNPDGTLFRGKPQLRLRHDQKQSFSTSDQGNLTGEDVYELDFSSFQSPGRYFVVVPGVGRSLPFGVAEDIYRQPFYHCARAIFHERCGIELKQPYTEYVRQPQ